MKKLYLLCKEYVNASFLFLFCIACLMFFSNANLQSRRFEALCVQSLSGKGQFRFVIERQLPSATGATLLVKSAERAGNYLLEIPKPDRIFHPGAQILATINLENVENIKSVGYRNYLKSQGICALTRRSQIEFVAPGPLPASLAEQARAELRSMASESLGEHGGIFTALLIGDRSDLIEADYDQLRKLGLSHIIAVSGSHFAVLMEILQKLLARLQKQGQLLAVFLLLSCYLFLLNGNAAATRAYATTATALWSLTLGRKLSFGWQLLFSLALAQMLLPNCLSDVGFQMSLLGWLAVKLLPLPQILRREPWASVVIGFCLLPVVIFFFAEANLLAPLLGVFLVPAYLGVQKICIYLLPLALASMDLVHAVLSRLLTGLQLLTDLFAAWYLPIAGENWGWLTAALFGVAGLWLLVKFNELLHRAASQEFHC
jgi:ComEC/Rec2-related protein